MLNLCGSQYKAKIKYLSIFYQIAFEGIKGVSGFVALDDIEYNPGVNCNNQLVDPKPGEMHQFKHLDWWLNTYRHSQTTCAVVMFLPLCRCHSVNLKLVSPTKLKRFICFEKGL